MKKAVVIGAYGHIGSYMVPALYDAGYEVTVISRGTRESYTAEHPAWQHVNKQMWLQIQNQLHLLKLK